MACMQATAFGSKPAPGKGITTCWAFSRPGDLLHWEAQKCHQQAWPGLKY